MKITVYIWREITQREKCHSKNNSYLQKLIYNWYLSCWITIKKLKHTFKGEKNLRENCKTTKANTKCSGGRECVWWSSFNSGFINLPQCCNKYKFTIKVTKLRVRKATICENQLGTTVTTIKQTLESGIIK